MSRIRRAVRSGLFAGTCLMAFGLGMATGQASVQNEMDALFNSMSNVTSPGVWDTQRRGVFAGGQATIKNRIMNESLVSFVPPSFEAGCGGIDLFGGSFSFINSDQLVQLMRGVAANAAGYAFQLALSSMAPDVAQTIEMMQKKVQELNQYFGNSCQLAQGLVNDTLGAALGKQQTQASLIGTFNGAGDVFMSFGSSDGKDPLDKADEVASEEVDGKIRGNLVWRALKQNGVSGWFQYGDNALLEVAMNITGTVVVGDDVPTAEDPSREEPQIIPLSTNRVTVRDLMDGGSITYMGCADGFDANECRELTTKTLDLKGFRQMVLEKLIGTDSSPGIILKLSRQVGTLNVADQAFLSPQTAALGSLVIQLSKHGEYVATEFARQAAPHMALRLAETVLNDLARSVEATISATDNPHVKQVQEQIEQARQQLANEQLRVRAEVGSEQDLLDQYQALLEVARKHRMEIINTSARY